MDRKIKMDSVARYGWIKLPGTDGKNCQEGTY